MADVDVFSAISSVPDSHTTSVISLDCSVPYDNEDELIASKSPGMHHYPDPPSFMTTSSSSSHLFMSTVQPVVTILQTDGTKRPQLKYDPDVPMTREQTRAWRRDQRRKRNRESAAACRKRQRDLISVLEGEVAVWKAKFDNALSKIKERDGEGTATELRTQIEAMFVMPTHQETERSCATPSTIAHAPDEICSMGMEHISNVVSPFDHPQFISYHSTSSSYNHHELHFPVLDDDDAKGNCWSRASTPDEFKNTTTSRVEKRQHLNEIITRPAQSRLLSLLRQGFEGWC